MFPLSSILAVVLSKQLLHPGELSLLKAVEHQPVHDPERELLRCNVSFVLFIVSQCLLELFDPQQKPKSFFVGNSRHFDNRFRVIDQHVRIGHTRVNDCIVMQCLVVILEHLDRFSVKNIDSALIRFVSNPANLLSSENGHRLLLFLFGRILVVFELANDVQTCLMRREHCVVKGHHVRITQIVVEKFFESLLIVDFLLFYVLNFKHFNRAVPGHKEKNIRISRAWVSFFTNLNDRPCRIRLVKMVGQRVRGLWRRYRNYILSFLGNLVEVHNSDLFRGRPDG